MEEDPLGTEKDDEGAHPVAFEVCGAAAVVDAVVIEPVIDTIASVVI